MPIAIAEIRRVVGFPWLRMKIQPEPGSSAVARFLLLGPHVLEGLGKGFGWGGAILFERSENQRVENGLCAAGLGGLVRTDFFVAVERLHIVPASYAQRDIG
jgi:hypothetical protein